MDHIRRQLTVVALTLGAAVTGCRGDGATARTASPAVVDSAVPREEALARFRRGLPAVTGLGGGAPSRDVLVRRFAAALERADTGALQRMRLSQAEFAWLYYPTNPQALPPYDLPPGLMWDLLTLDSDKGLRRALRDFGGRPLGLRGYRCDPAVTHQGGNTVAGPCEVVLGAGPDTVSLRLFGLVVERHGRHKFVSYANKL